MIDIFHLYLYLWKNICKFMEEKIMKNINRKIRAYILMFVGIVFC